MGLCILLAVPICFSSPVFRSSPCFLSQHRIQTVQLLCVVCQNLKSHMHFWKLHVKTLRCILDMGASQCRFVSVVEVVLKWRVGLWAVGEVKMSGTYQSWWWLTGLDAVVAGKKRENTVKQMSWNYCQFICNYLSLVYLSIPHIPYWFDLLSSTSSLQELDGSSVQFTYDIFIVFVFILRCIGL